MPTFYGNNDDENDGDDAENFWRHVVRIIEISQKSRRMRMSRITYDAVLSLAIIIIIIISTLTRIGVYLVNVDARALRLTAAEVNRRVSARTRRDNRSTVCSVDEVRNASLGWTVISVTRRIHIVRRQPGCCCCCIVRRPLPWCYERMTVSQGLYSNSAWPFLRV